MNKSFQSLEDLRNSKNPCYFFWLMIFDILQNKIQFSVSSSKIRFSCGTTNDNVVIEIFLLGYQTLVADFD